MKGKMFGMMAAASTILLSGAILISTAAISAQPVQAAEEYAAGSMQRQVEWGIVYQCGHIRRTGRGVIFDGGGLRHRDGVG